MCLYRSVHFCAYIQAYRLVSGASDVWCEEEANVTLFTAMTNRTLSQFSCVGSGSQNNNFLHSTIIFNEL